MKTVRTICGYCGVGCKLYFNVENNKIVGLSEKNKVLCLKGRKGYEFVYHPDRLTAPLIKKGSKFIKATWGEALELVAKRLRGIKDNYGSEALGVLSSSKCTNEENYIIQKFARAVLGTNNIDNCARL